LSAAEAAVVAAQTRLPVLEVVAVSYIKLPTI